MAKRDPTYHDGRKGVYACPISPPLVRQGPRGATRQATHFYAIRWYKSPAVLAMVRVTSGNRSIGWWDLADWLAYGHSLTPDLEIA